MEWVGPRRLARTRTPAFHADDTGSNPVGDAKGFFQIHQSKIGKFMCSLQYSYKECIFVPLRSSDHEAAGSP